MGTGPPTPPIITRARGRHERSGNFNAHTHEQQATQANRVRTHTVTGGVVKEDEGACRVRQPAQTEASGGVVVKVCRDTRSYTPERQQSSSPE
jgi:hypothetical protein